ncbi:hypothetical protein HQ590_12910 [bacterium]|nr:hypothetical protein [bacterium]
MFDIGEVEEDTATDPRVRDDSLERAGKEPIARSVAYYAVQRTRSGRRSYGSGCTDVLSPGARLDHGLGLLSIDQEAAPGGDDPSPTLGESLAAPVEDPATIAARAVDWDELEDLLDDRECRVVQGLSLGRGTGELAGSFRVSPSRVTQIQREIAAKIRESWGDGALVQVGQEPRCKACLRAHERVAG